MYKKSSLVMLSVIGLLGCGGSDSPSDTILIQPVPVDPVIVPPVSTLPQLNDMSISLKPLKSVNETSFETHYKNGLYLATLTDDGKRYLNSGDVSTSEASSSSADGFSETITQEAGVDEADRVKYDGDYLYIANNGGYIHAIDEGTKIATSTPYSANVRILKRQADDTLLTVNTLNIGDVKNSPNIDGLYLSEGRLTVLSSTYSYGSTIEPLFHIWYHGARIFNVSLFDTSTPNVANEITDLTIDGNIISSRRVDKNLIIVSSYNKEIEGLIMFPQNDKEKQANYDLIQKIDINTLLPQYTDANGVTKNLVNADNCFIPEDATDADGYDGIVTLTTINIADPSEITSICINSSVQGLYATPSSVYTYGSVDQKSTVIHKFSMDGQSIDYKASTSFAGHVFGGGQSNLRFSELGDYLRVVVTENTDDSSDRFEHLLKVFSENETTNELELVAQLPNAAHPEKLGKDDEDIYAVRYFGSKAYIVTFKSMDPLYVLNLEDNTQPFVESSLEIIGYSSYLHPISEDLILGIGQNIDPSRFITPDEPEDGVEPEKIIEGAKVALFDVSGEPRLVKEFVFEGGYTPAEFNYHALTYLKVSDDKHLFAMPIESWVSTADIATDSVTWNSNSALELFEVNISGADAELSHAGSVAPSYDNDNYYGSWNDRAIIHGDLIFYVHGADVYKSSWLVPNDIEGPF